MRQFSYWKAGNIHFPHQPYLDVGNKSKAHYSEVIKRLTPFLQEERIAKINQVLNQRSYSIVPILENSDDLGNAYASIRSLEALGLSTLHLVQGNDKLRGRSVAIGSDKWVDVFRWKDPEKCYSTFKEQGYTLYATTICDGAIPIEEVDFTQKTALIFGNEHSGVSNEALKFCDKKTFIPMIGFTRSFNVAVALSLCLYEAKKFREKAGVGGDLSAEEKEILRAIYYLKTIKFFPLLFRDYN